jgi:hypothetical protein
MYSFSTSLCFQVSTSLLQATCTIFQASDNRSLLIQIPRVMLSCLCIRSFSFSVFFLSFSGILLTLYWIDSLSSARDSPHVSKFYQDQLLQISLSSQIIPARQIDKLAGESIRSPLSQRLKPPRSSRFDRFESLRAHPDLLSFRVHSQLAIIPLNQTTFCVTLKTLSRQKKRISFGLN